jgi:hypothetical protein
MRHDEYEFFGMDEDALLEWKVKMSQSSLEGRRKEQVLICWNFLLHVRDSKGRAAMNFARSMHSNGLCVNYFF